MLLRICALIICASCMLGGIARAAPAKEGSKKSASKSSASAAKEAKSSRISKSSGKKSYRISLSHAGDPLVGKASWYGRDFHGSKTASGVPYDKWSYTAAHRTLPIGTVVEVMTDNTGQRVLVCINNRGPFIAGRVIDLSRAAAQDIGLDRKGIMSVRLTVVSDAEGRVTDKSRAFYVRLAESAGRSPHRLGPFTQYADASVLRDVLLPKHPDVRVTLEAL